MKWVWVRPDSPPETKNMGDNKKIAELFGWWNYWQRCGDLYLFQKENGWWYTDSRISAVSAGDIKTGYFGPFETEAEAKDSAYAYWILTKGER